MTYTNSITKRSVFDEPSHTYKVDGIALPSVTEIVAPLTYTKYRVDNAVIDQAAYRGRMVHELTALYDRGDLEDSTISLDVGMYVMAWIKFCHDYTPQWEYIELGMACSEFAGTVDRIGIIDDTRVIVDIKTSNIDRAAKIALCAQICGYDKLAFENHICCASVASFGVQLKKDGNYSIIKLADVEEKYGFNSHVLFDELLNLNKLVKGEKKVK